MKAFNSIILLLAESRMAVLLRDFSAQADVHSLPIMINYIDHLSQSQKEER